MIQARLGRKRIQHTDGLLERVFRSEELDVLGVR